MLVLVRHGHAGDKQSWRQADELRPLSDRGHQQARGLLVSLSALAPARLVTSPYLRCRQTLMPWAARTGQVLESAEELRPDADVTVLDRMLDPDADDVVLCTHGETLNGLFSFWGRTRRLELATNGVRVAQRSTEKGGAWIVLPGTDHGGLLAQYVRPVLVGPVTPTTTPVVAASGDDRAVRVEPA